MNWTGCKWVESVPGRLGGTPVVVGSRMPADGVLANFDSGVRPEEIADYFDLELEKVEGVLAFAGRLERTAAA